MPERKRRWWLWLLAALIALMIAALALAPRSFTGKEHQDTERVLAQLGISWNRPGPPVVVFMSPG